jgi:hypothetical protein
MRSPVKHEVYNGGMRRLVPLVLLCAGTLVVATEIPPEVLLLQRARVRMATNLTRLPNYTCLQTIERFLRSKPDKKPQLSDTVRIEVALVNGNELFAWPGSGRFLDVEISELVPGGAIGTGNFALHAKNIFQTSAPQFTYRGEVVREGRRTLRWDFTVPQILSGYRLKVNVTEASVGYHGSFWVDADTLDLIRLEVRADTIPPALQLAEAGDAIDYAPMQIGDGTFLLPSAAEMEMVGLNGAASINRTVFTGCRQYTGESRLVFDDPPPETARPEPLRTLNAPPDINVEIALETPIAYGRSAINDPVTAVLSRPVKLGKGLTAPKGAIVRGRLTYIAPQSWDKFPGYDVGLVLSELEWGSYRVSLNAKLEQVYSAHPPVYIQTEPRTRLTKVRPQHATMGSIFFVRNNTPVRLNPGLRMLWRTETIKTGESQ